MSSPLIVCGMHRSGTSLVASALERAGLAIGRDVASPGLGNPRGHFEDSDFLDLHEEMLAAKGESCFSIGPDFEPPADVRFVDRARELVAERQSNDVWGWKDPRTTLFLEFWDHVVPDARYLFLYRPPVDVALSLWRRNGDLELREAPWRVILAWEVYNRRLLDFAARHPHRCHVAQVPAVAADLGTLVRALRDDLGVPLREDAVGAVYVPRELSVEVPPNPVWEGLIPEALALYRLLEERAARPALGNGPGELSPESSRELVLLRAAETLLFALLERCDRKPRTETPSIDQRKAYHRIRMEDEAAVALDFALESGLPETSEMAAALVRERERIEELIAGLIDERERCAAAEARAAELGRTIRGIEQSWSFAPTRAWWWLRGRLGRRKS